MFGIVVFLIINLYFRLFFFFIIVFDDFLLEIKLLLYDFLFDSFVLIVLFVGGDIGGVIVFLFDDFFNRVELDLVLLFLNNCLWEGEFIVDSMVGFFCFRVLGVGGCDFVKLVVFFWFFVGVCDLWMLSDKFRELVRFF